MPPATYLSSSNRRCARLSRSSSDSARSGRRDDNRRRMVRRIAGFPRDRRSVLEQKLVDEARETAPALRLLRERAVTRARQRIELGFAVGFRPAPGALDPALLLHADERRIQGALIEGQRMVRHLLETGRE